MAAAGRSYSTEEFTNPNALGFEKLSFSQSEQQFEFARVPRNWLSVLEPDATGLSLRSPSASFNARRTIYQPLNANPQDLEIRLLTVEDYDDERGRLFCILNQYPLDETPDYYALSYHWGESSESSQRQVINVNGFDFEVQLNLWDALQALRRRGHKTIWADAICLNQDNDEEKAQQVPRMKLIYQQARGVAIWLGREADGSAELIQLLKEFAQTDVSRQHEEQIRARVPILEDEYRSVMPKTEMDKLLDALASLMLQKIPQRLEDMSQEEYLELWARTHEKTMGQFNSFFSRPFWRRIWIVQEVSSARSVAVFCGNDMIRWDHLACMSLLDDGKTDWDDGVDVGGRNVDIIKQLRYKIQNRIPIGLLTALQRTYGFQSGRIQDKFYALLGLAWDSAEYIPTVSYAKDFSRNRIMFDMTRQWMRSGFVDIICLQPHTSHNDFSVPSWLPKFITAGQSTMSNRLVDYLESRRPLTLLTKYGHSWSATGRSRSNFHRFLDNNRILLVRGVHIDTVDGLSMACDPYYADPTLKRVWQSQSPPPTDVTEMKRIRSDLYWTLNMYKTDTASGIADQNVNLDGLFTEELKQLYQEHDLQTQWDWLEAIRSFRIFGRPFEQWLLNRPKYRNMAKLAVLNYLVKDPENSSNREKHGKSIADAYGDVFDDGRRLMTTQYGRVGWAHPSARPGDRIYLLEGCNLPVILAPSNTMFEGHPTCAVVGDAYVHGVMYGALWEQVREHLGDVFLS